MWLTYTLISLGFFTGLFVFSKILTTNSKDQRAFSVLYSLFASLWALVFFLIETDLNSIVFPSGIIPYLVLTIACVFYGVFERYRFKVMKNIDISLFSIILTLAPVTAFVGSSILYKEPLTSIKIIGGALIIFSNIWFELKTASWKIIALDFLNSAGYYLQLKALTLGEATRVIPIVQASLIFTVLLGIFFLKEKENKIQKIIAGIACFLGVVLLSR